MYTCLHNTHVHTHINLPNRGDSLVVQKGDVSACAWMDRKVVMVIFSNAQPSATVSVLRRLKDHTRTPISCPEAVQLYNKYMGGVDRGDQLRGYYACRTKSSHTPFTPLSNKDSRRIAPEKFQVRKVCLLQRKSLA